MAVRAGDIPFANTHAAMSPALMRDLKNRLNGARSLERLSSLDSAKRPNLLLSGRASAQSSHRSSLRSSISSLNDIPGAVGSSINSSSEKNLERSGSVNLPRIPSRVLKEREGNILNSSASAKAAGSSHHDDDDDDDGQSEKKVRKLSTSSSSSASPGSTPRDGAASSVDTELEKQKSLQRQTSEMSSVRSPVSSARSSFSSARGLSLTSSVKRNGHVDDAGRKEETAGVALRRLSRQSSTASEEDRSSTGVGILQMSFQSRRSSSSSSSAATSTTEDARGRAIAKNRPSFQTIKGSSTPDLSRTSPRSSRSSASSSFSAPKSPPPPLALSSAGSPSRHSSTSPPLPSPPPPSPPPLPSPLDAPALERSLPCHVTSRDVEPLPTPPPTPHHIPDDSLPLPSPPPDAKLLASLHAASSSVPIPSLDLIPPPPASPALSSKSSSSSSSEENEENSVERLESKLKTIAGESDSAPGAPRALRHSQAAPVIHFPPPPDYPPSPSPSHHHPLSALSHATQTSPARPATPRSDESSPDSSDRLTSTSTEVVLRYLDSALDPYSAPVTPSLALSNLPTPTSPAFRDALPSPEPEAKRRRQAEERKFDSKRSKGDNRSKRRLSSTQTTKYDGSVKTVRKQIKPGHVDELRNIFIAQDASDDDAPRHGRRRLGGRRSSSLNDDNDDDSGSGYTTTSSDNEYDLEHAERINSPEYRSDVVFASVNPAETPRFDENVTGPSSTAAHEWQVFSAGGTAGERDRRETSVFTGNAVSKGASRKTSSASDVEGQVSVPGRHPDGVETIQADDASSHLPSPSSSSFTVTAASPSLALHPPTDDLRVSASDTHTESTSTHVTLSQPLHADNNQQAENSDPPSATYSVKTLLQKFQPGSQGGAAQERSSASLQKSSRTRNVTSSADAERYNRSRVVAEAILPVKLAGDHAARDVRNQDAAIIQDAGRDKHEEKLDKTRREEAAKGEDVETDKKMSLHSPPIATRGSPAPGAAEVYSARGVVQEEGEAGREGKDHVIQPLPNKFRPVDEGAPQAGAEKGKRREGADSERDPPSKRSSVSSTDSSESEGRSEFFSGAGERLAHREPLTPVLSSAHPPSAHQDRFSLQMPSPKLTQAGADDTKLLDAAAERTSSVVEDRSHHSGGDGSRDFLSMLDDIHIQSETVSNVKIEKARQLQKYKDSLTPSSSFEEKEEDKVFTQKSFAAYKTNSGDEIPEGKVSSLPGSDVSIITKDDKQSSVTSADHAPDEADGNKAEMAAAVGEVTSFTLRRDWKERGRASSSSSSSSESSSGLSRGVEENAADVYVYQDSRGDVYVMQDVTDQPGPSTTTTTTANAYSKGGALDDSSTNSGTTASFDFPGLTSSSTVTLDTQSVDVHKAKEVISAFFSDEASSQQRHQQGLRQHQQQQLQHQQQQLQHQQEQAHRHEEHRSFSGHSQFAHGSASRDAQFSMLAGNVGLDQNGAARRSYTSATTWNGSGNAAHETDQVDGRDVHRTGNYVSSVTVSAGGTTSGQDSHHQQYQPHLTNSVSHPPSSSQLGQQWGGADSSTWSGQQGQQQQQHSSSFTVSTTTSAVVGEHTQLKIHIPPNAVPVLPTHVQSASRVRDIAPIMPDAGPSFQSTLKPRADLSYNARVLESDSTFRQSGNRRDSDSSLSSDEDEAGRSRHTSNLRKSSDSDGQRQSLVASGMSISHGTSAGNDYQGPAMYSSQKFISANESMNKNRYEASEWETRAGQRDVHFSHMPSNAMSRDEAHVERFYDNHADQQPHYVLSRLRRADSGRNSQTDETSMRRASNTEGFDSHSNSYSDARYVSRVNVRGSNSFQDNDDSQYGSQTSKATSLGDMSPTDERTFRIIRAEQSQTYFQPPPQKQTIHTTVDRTARATKDYHQRELNRSHEAIYRQQNNAQDVWRVDNFSRSVPDLSLPLLENSFSTFAPSQEDDDEGHGHRYRLVKTSHNGSSSRTGKSTSSDSDSDSGVGDNKRYRTVTRVEMGGDGYRRRLHSTGSLRNSSGVLSLRPRSPSPPVQPEYRLSGLESQRSWETRKEEQRQEDGRVYRVVQVAPSDDRPSRTENKSVLGSGRRKSSVYDDSPDDERAQPFRIVRTSSNEKILADEATREVRGYKEVNRYSYPARLDSGFFDAESARQLRSSAPNPSGTLTTPPPGTHKTVIRLDVGREVRDPVHYPDAVDHTHYRVVEVKASDSRQPEPVSSSTHHSFDTAWSSSTAHNRSFPSPVSGYESDLDRTAVYSLNTSQPRQYPRHPLSSPPDYHTALAERPYVVASTQSSANRPHFVGAGEAFRRETGPVLRSAVSSTSSSSAQHHSQSTSSFPPAGQEWHKTTIDFRPSARSERGMQSHFSDMAPLQQQRVKSYMVFNSTDDLRSHSPPPLQRSNSQTFKSETKFVVSSPAASASPTSFPSSRRTFAREVEAASAAPPTIRVNGVDAVSDARLDSADEYRREVYEEKSYLFQTDSGHVMPETGSTEDLRVLRGKILIQNRLNDSKDQDDFLDNMNVFDTSFHLGKDNPLYQSDPDIYQSLQQEEQRSQSAIGQEVTQDITFETVDKIAKKHREGEVQLSPAPKRKQNLSSLLLSKLASIDSKDIHQHIDVQHHNEEVYGDVALVHADGTRARNVDTSTFDSINENVELMLKQGKAFVIIKVVAERIVPIDYEFNVWRKSQAIVTRNIEIDLHATEQRRRLYEHVMETAGRPAGALQDAGATASFSTGRAATRDEQERQLSSLETLRLFSQILDVADGKGDVDDTEMRARQEMGMLPGPSSHSAMDLLY